MANGLKLFPFFNNIGLGSVTAVFIGLQMIIIIYGMQLPDYKEMDNYRYMIVLGAGLDEDQVSQRLKGRLDEAVKYYYHYNKDVMIVVSGGQGKDE